jgi:hypothetical protein
MREVSVAAPDPDQLPTVRLDYFDHFVHLDRHGADPSAPLGTLS